MINISSNKNLSNKLKKLVFILILFVFSLIYNTKAYAIDKTYLTNIEIENQELNETFEKEYTNYTANVNKNVQSINIIVTKEYDDSIVTGDGVVSITEEDQSFDISVTSSDTGDVRIYNLDVHRYKAIPTFIPGPEFNERAIALSNRSNIYGFSRSLTPPTEENKTAEHIFSTSDSDGVIYVWFNGEVTWYSESGEAYLNEDSSNMFKTFWLASRIDTSGLDTSKVENMSGLLDGCAALSKFDVSNFNTNRVKNMSSMFESVYGNYTYKGFAQVPGLENLKTQNVTNMSSMFLSANIGPYNLQKWDTHNVEDMSYMFSRTQVRDIDLSYLDTSNVTNMAYLFLSSFYLESIDLHGWDVSKVENMSGTFYNVGTYGTIRKIDIRGWDTSNVTSMNLLFCNTSLETLEENPVKYLNTSNVTNMSEMFRGSKINGIDLTTLDTSKTTNMSSMFNATNSTTLDISNFDTSNVTNMSSMFTNASDLETIYVSDKFVKKAGLNSNLMFQNASSLVGQSGTTYDSNYVNGSYAVVDDPINGNPGYLTYKDFTPKIIYPDDTYEEVPMNYLFTFPDTYPKEDEDVTPVTLKYQDNNTEDGTVYVKKQFTLNNWTVGIADFDFGDTLTVTSNIALIPNYIETLVPADLPTPYRENYRFLGWYTEEEGGDIVTDYSLDEDITLYAHWEEATTVSVTTPKEVYYVPVGETFTIPVNDIDKADENAATVTFKYHDNLTADLEKYVVKSFEPDGWTDGTNDYQDEEEITVNEDITIEPKYIGTNSNIEFPSNPERERYIFKGWYTEETGGEEITSYSEDIDITIHAVWEAKEYVYVTTPTEVVELEKGSSYILPVNDIEKASENISEVTFKFQYDDKEDEIGYVKKVFTPTGWKINNVNYNNEEEITVNEDITIVPRYVYTINGVELPNPTRQGYNFDGWYDSPVNGNKIEVYNSDEDIILYSYWSIKTTYTISFETYGGSSVDSYEVNIDSELGDLPTSTKEDNLLEGWYLENTYENKVSSRTIVDSDVTLHAKWVEDRFPFVYPYHKEDLVCDGSNYINTGVMLYNNDNWKKDYEIGFTIEEYNSNSNVNQAVFVNTKYEKESLGWPGLAFRKSGNSLEITQNINGTKKNVTFGNYTSGYKVRIMRINKEVYYQINDGQIKSLQNMSNFNQQFEVPVYFCAGDDGSGGAQRYLKGTISNYYVRMGTYEDMETHTVTYPDNTVESYVHNSIVNLESNETTKNPEDLGSVTFMKHDGTPDTVSTVIKNYIPNGFMINGIHYDNESTLIIDEDKVITNAYDEEIEEAEFPSDPEKPHFTFIGWFDEETGGNKYTSYDGVENITLHAQYTQNMVTITTPDGDITVPEGSNYSLGTNDIEKSNETNDVTFKYHDNETNDLVKQVTKTYTPNGWLVNDVHYDDEASFEVNADTTIEPDYIEAIVPVEFPSEPTREHYTFDGWYTEETGGEKIENYSLDEDITLHAHWIGETQTITTPDGEEEVPYGTEYTLGTNDTPKEDDTYTVTFKYHDDLTGDLEKPVTVQFTPNGWLVNDVHYDDEASFEVTENAVIEPDYIETVIPVEFPSDPTRDNYEFLGWFDAEEDGTEYTSYNEKTNITLHAQWKITLPTDITIDSEDITIVVGETHQIEVTFIPDGSNDTITYTGFDSDKISVVDGIVTGLAEGSTTVTIGTENTDIEKTVNVTVVNNVLTSDIYSVRDIEHEDLTKDRIVIGAEDGTLISEFKDNMLNPNEYIKIYDDSGNEVLEEDIVKTGLVIKLEYNGLVLDEASMVVRGDVDGDGFVNVTDYIAVLNHALVLEEIDDYIKFAAGDVEEDEILNVTDYIKIMDYALKNIDSIND